MKKLLLSLLLISTIASAQITPFDKIREKGAVESATDTQIRSRNATSGIGGWINRNEIILPYNTAGRDAIVSPEEGAVIYNLTTKQLNVFNGTAWVAVGGGNYIPTSGTGVDDPVTGYVIFSNPDEADTTTQVSYSDVTVYNDNYLSTINSTGLSSSNRITNYQISFDSEKILFSKFNTELSIRFDNLSSSNQKLQLPEIGAGNEETFATQEWVDENYSGGGGGGAVTSVNAQTGVVVLNQDNIADGTVNKGFKVTEQTKLSGIATGATANQSDATTNNSIATKVTANTAITGATKTKITYDSKGLVTAGADATTADIPDSTNKRYSTDAQLAAIATNTTAIAALPNLNPISVTGTTPAAITTEQIVASGTVTGGTLKNGSANDLSLICTKPVAGTQNVTIKVYINSSLSLTGATQLATYTWPPASVWVLFTRKFGLAGGNLICYPTTASAMNDTGSTGVVVSPITYNPANTFVWFATLSFSNTSDTAMVEVMNLKTSK